MVPTRRDVDRRPPPALANWRFVADRPNQLWLTYMTYLPIWACFIYPAVVLNAWSGCVVGWTLGERMTA